MEIDVPTILQNIANEVVPEFISMEEVLAIPDYHATLKVQIFNNKIFTNKEITEERNIQILNQLRETINCHELPNTIFAYCTQDHTPNNNCVLFSHAIQTNVPNKNIPAPCFTFDDYTCTHAVERMKYEDSRISLYENARLSMETFESWNKKEDTIIFIGTLNDDNDRIENTQFGEIKNVNQIIKNNPGPMSFENYVPREALIQYKYLLHLNGHIGAYSSRLKYLLMAGSLCFYITNYKRSDYGWMEYWMFYEEILNSIVIAKNTSDCKNIIEQYDVNRMAAYERAKKGFDIIHQLITKQNVLLYWKLLLEKYSSKFVANEQIYFVPYV
jgi:hypothetical protein